MAKGTPLTEIKGVGKKTEEALNKAGIKTIESLAKLNIEKLSKKVPDISKNTLIKVLDSAQDYILESEVKKEKPVKEKKAKKIEKKVKKTRKEVKKEVKTEIKAVKLGVIYSFRKGGNRIYPNIALAKIYDPNIKLGTLIGKSVWLEYANGIKRNGQITNIHGKSGSVKVKFSGGLSANAIGSYLYLRV
jgi:ribosomal protein L35AE/L33A